ncbi:AAA family ATPase [Nonomuraea sp. NPDC049152]|uniref:AAA family ATPase n=1 Tax=Nonomuraea sp. NPDC049152 TaxID=3154350 RepID=UPI0033EBA904
MRPHRLTLTAFGSFPGTETVDFDSLAEAGLFLVHGPTGAGKTTLLDALCFALYGVVPGQRNSARSLRCDHAPPSVGPSVTLEVTLRGRLLRIQRSPAWTRPKLRGAGVTEEKAKVIVSEQVRGVGWQGLTTRADEAGDLVGGLLGMNADQFCQVAMLPQGDFARFLRADGEERRRLLERLFTVKVFTSAEAWLAERRKQTWRESQEGRQEVEYAVKRLEEAAGDVLAPRAEVLGTVPAPRADSDGGADPTVPTAARVDSGGGMAPPVPRADSDGGVAPTAESDPLAWSGLLRSAAEAVVGHATEAWAAGEVAVREHRERFERASALADRQRRHAEAVALRRSLDDRAEERSDLLTVLDEAARADRVLPLINAARQRAAAAGKARGLAADAIARATPLLGPLTSNSRSGVASRSDVDSSSGVDSRSGVDPREGAGPDPGAGSGRLTGRDPSGPAVDPDMLAGLERERLDEITRVSELLADENRLAQLRRDLGAAEQEIATLSTRERAAAARLEELPALVKAADDAAATARLDAAVIPAAEAARSAAAALLEAIERRDRLSADLAAAQADLTTRLRDPALTHALADLATRLRGSGAVPSNAGLSGPGVVSSDARPRESDVVPADHPAPLEGLGPDAQAAESDHAGDVSHSFADAAHAIEALRSLIGAEGAAEAPRFGKTAGPSRFGEAAWAPRVEETVGIPQFEEASGPPRVEETVGAPQFGETGGAGRVHRGAGAWRVVRERARLVERVMGDQLAALEGLRADESRLTELDERLAVLTAELDTLAEREGAGRAAMDELPTALHDVTARLAEARAAEGRLPSAIAARDAAASWLAVASRRHELEGEVEAARAAHGVAVEQAQDLRDRLQEVRQARIEGMAAELAAELSEGEPCAVCGSAEHPSPAEPAEIAYAADDEIEAQAAYDAALAERQAADGLLSSLTSRLDELADAPAPDEAAAELAAAEDEVAALTELAKEEPACERAALALESQLEQARDQLHETERRLAEARTAIAASAGERERIHARLEEARGVDASLGARRRRLGGELLLLAELARAAERVGEITARLDDALDTLTRLLTPAPAPSAVAHDLATAASAPFGAGHPWADGSGFDGPAAKGAASPGSEASGGAEGAASPGSEASGGVGGVGAEGAGSPGSEGPGDVGDDGAEGGGLRLDGSGLWLEDMQGTARDAEPRKRAAEATRAWASAELDAADHEAARLRAAAAAHPRLAARAAELADEHVRTTGAFRELGLRLAACRTRAEELRAEAARLAARIDDARGADPTLTARLDRLREEAQLLREAHEATQAAESAVAEHRRAVEAAEQAALAAGFVDGADVLPAVRTQEEREEKAERLRELDAAHAAVTRTLADPELVAAAAEPAPDLAAMEFARQEAERAHTALASARDRAERRVRRLAELHDELAACLGHWQPAADRHRLAERLAALASGTSGDNQWSMSLSSYVLGERLRQVVDAANERLDHMSGGRYQLQHDLRKTAGARGRAGGGLGLRVLDAWTGVDRDPATLSGGESFITSLALALGLADVVSAEAGGAEIGMLFVDEGFGTLDEDTLDGVLDILDGLRDGGRAVGIVSHVGELRTRIPAQLKVTKARAGSTLAVTAP